MNLSLIILLLALLAVVSFFVIKIYEFNTGKLLISIEKRHQIEKKLTDFYKMIIDWVVHFSNKTGILLKELPNIIVHTSHFYWRKFSKKVDNFFLRIRRKK